MLGGNVSLPSLILQEIFEHLGRHVLQAVLVSHDWYLFLKHKRYWKQIRIRIDKDNVGMVMASDRLNLVAEVELHHLPPQNMPKLFQYLAANHTLKEKTLKCVCICCEENNYVDTPELNEEDVVLGQVDLDDIACVVSQLVHFEVDCPKDFRWLSDIQVEHIVRSIAQSTNLPLKFLRLGDKTFYSCTPESYAAAMIQLDEIDIRNCYISGEQLTKLCESIINCTRKKPKKIESNGFDEVAPEVLAKALCKIQSVSWRFYIDSNVLLMLCEDILNESKLELRRLKLVDISLTQLPSQLLAHALCKLHTVKLVRAYEFILD